MMKTVYDVFGFEFKLFLSTRPAKVCSEVQHGMAAKRVVTPTHSVCFFDVIACLSPTCDALLTSCATFRPSVPSRSGTVPRR